VRWPDIEYALLEQIWGLSDTIKVVETAMSRLSVELNPKRVAVVHAEVDLRFISNNIFRKIFLEPRVKILIVWHEWDIVFLAFLLVEFFKLG
jgi:hypothetical protein